MRTTVSLHLELIKLQALSQLEYRGAINILFIAKIIGFGSGYVLIWLMLSTFKIIAGWQLYEVLFLQSLYMTVYALASSLFYNSVTQLPKSIATGEFDAILIRPINTLFYFMFRIFSTGYLGNLFVSITVLTFSWIKLDIALSFINLFFLIITILGGVLIQSAVYIFSSLPNFWLIKGGVFTDIIVFDFASFIKYPVTIFNKNIQFLLTFIVPYAFINFYPTQYFIKKNDFGIFPDWFQFLTPVVGIIFFFLAYILWNIAIKYYQSSGS